MTNPSQTWNPDLYDREHSYVYTFGGDLIGLLKPARGERILDVGCGNGHLTNRIAESGALVTGIDQSQEMIDAARVAYPEIQFIRADATDFSLPESFDAVFSNAALHWIAGTDADKAVACVSGAVRPGGRFVVEFGGKGNIARVRAAVDIALRELGKPVKSSPWYFPSIGEYAPLLERHGLLVRTASLFDRPTRVEAGEHGMRSWLAMFGGRLLSHLDSDEKEYVVKRVEEQLRPFLFDKGAWTIDYRRLRLVASKDHGYG
jgi:trans-aconitate methyltransferase